MGFGAIGEQTAVREEKHISILKRMDGLNAAIAELEGLADRIDPQPTNAKIGAVQPNPSPSLARFLDSAPGEIAEFSDRLNAVMNRIKAAVL